MLSLQFLLDNKGYTSEQLSKLTELDLHDNEIESIHPKLFEDLTKLILTSNYGITYHARLFDHCENITSLDLSGNKLTTFDENTFKQLNKLSVLRLHNNQIESIHQNLFKTCSNLKELYLHENKFKKIYRNTFDHFESIQIISIYSNQIYALSFYDGKFSVPSVSFRKILENIKEKGYFSNFEQFLEQFGIVSLFLLLSLFYLFFIYFIKKFWIVKRFFLLYCNLI